MSGQSPPPQQSQYALYVALQTMKKRCQTLQQRLTHVEEENISLRAQRSSVASLIDSPPTPTRKSRGSERSDQLQAIVHELQLQLQQQALVKQQTTERLTLIATENQELWARLSQIAKTPVLPVAGDTMAAADAPTSNSTQQHQNLIRSRTFTQNAPNLALRTKQADVATASSDASLEEISLKVLNEFLEKKAEAEKLCSDLSGADGDEGSADGAVDSFGFGFLSDNATVNSNDVDDELMNVGGNSGGDWKTQLKRCAEGMSDIRKEVLCQQSDIKVALSSLRQRRFLDACPSCKHQLRRNIAAKSTNPTTIEDTAADLIISAQTAGADDVQHVHIDLLEQKRLADALDKMCPMCAKMYTCNMSFDAFQEHVESHFIDDSEPDNSFDRKFEMLSHTVGDF